MVASQVWFGSAPQASTWPTQVCPVLYSPLHTLRAARNTCKQPAVAQRPSRSRLAFQIYLYLTSQLRRRRCHLRSTSDRCCGQNWHRPRPATPSATFVVPEVSQRPGFQSECAWPVTPKCGMGQHVRRATWHCFACLRLLTTLSGYVYGI